MTLAHNAVVFRNYGLRYWLAWKLAKLAHFVKDANFWEAVKTPDGALLLIEADAWGSGLVWAEQVDWYQDHTDPNRAVLRAFDDEDAAWAWIEEKQ